MAVRIIGYDDADNSFDLPDEVITTLDVRYAAVGSGGPAGPTGLTGEIGPQGDQGPQGVPGVSDIPGPQGEIGPQGLKGDQGVPGVSDIPGPQGEVGPQGLKGDQGIPGVSDIPGPQGEVGPQGVKGDTGADSIVPGPQGEIGPQGLQGDPGPQGDPGVDGIDNAKWHSVAGPPDPGLYVVDDWYLDSTTGDVYEKTDATTWVLRANITGPAGAGGTGGSGGPAAPAPLLRVSKPPASNIAAGVVIPYAVVDDDSESGWNATTHAYTVSVTGAYLVVMTMQTQNNKPAPVFRVNGVNKIQTGYVTTMAWGGGSVTGVMQLVAGNVVDVINAGDAYTPSVDGESNYFHLIGMASKGDPGPAGPTGPAGLSNSHWYSGAGAPVSEDHVAGDWYLDNTSGDAYEKTDELVWTLRTNIKGSQGPMGPQGASIDNYRGEWVAVPLVEKVLTFGEIPTDFLSLINPTPPWYIETKADTTTVLTSALRNPGGSDSTTSELMFSLECQAGTGHIWLWTRNFYGNCRLTINGTDTDITAMNGQSIDRSFPTVVGANTFKLKSYRYSGYEAVIWMYKISVPVLDPDSYNPGDVVLHDGKPWIFRGIRGAGIEEPTPTSTAWLGLQGDPGPIGITGPPSANPDVLGITYNGNGNIDTVTEDGVVTTFTYNPDGTVATDTRNGITRTYTYTDGNLTVVSA